MSESSSEPVLNKYHCSWHHTMLRVKDPSVSVPFYEKNFGMKEVARHKFDQMKFTIHFLAILSDEAKAPADPESKEAKDFLFHFKGTVIELTHNHGSENDPNLKYNNGNVEPNRGFGHIAFNCDDVYASCAQLERNGVKFQKKPDEGRMKGLAFALDPDGYWLEIVRRDMKFTTEFNLSQTMMRIKDPEKSIPFYTNIIGMKLVMEKHFIESKFSLYFLASLPKEITPPDPKSEEAAVFVKQLWNPVLELTHNHGTESDPNFKYHSGNEEPKGFGHIAFLLDDLDSACADLEKHNVQFKKKPTEGSIRNIAFVLDPDGYWIELAKRGLVL